MKGQREKSKASAYPVSEARREMHAIGKTKLEYHTRAVVREIEGYDKSRVIKKGLERKVMDIMDEIIALGEQQCDDDLGSLWSEWDKEC